MDAPFHMIERGRTLSEIPLDTLVGTATVVEIPAARSVGRAELEPLNWTGVERVLLKTENSKHWNDGKFYEEFVYLEPEGAQFLVDRGVRLVGIDYLSIDKFHSESHPSHFVLLEKNVVIIEGLNLNAVPQGNYTIYALPLNLQDADGGPTRVVLIK
jgi:arylformamidase